MKKIIIVLGGLLISTFGYSQVFTLDTTMSHIVSKVSEITFSGGYKYLSTRGSIMRTFEGGFDWGGSIPGVGCLHDNSRYRDMELLSNGSLTGLFYHAESCIPEETVFLMLDSNGNVLVDKRFADGLSPSDGGILQQDTIVHVYVRHSLVIPEDGIVHYRYSLSGVLLDSTIKTVNFHYNGLKYIKPYGDSLMINGFERLPNGDLKWKLIITDYDLDTNYREVYSHPDFGFDYSKNYADTNVFIFYKDNGSMGLGAIELISKSERFYDNHSANSSIWLRGFIKINGYYVVMESVNGFQSNSDNLLVINSDFKLVHREAMGLNMYYSQFIKTSDSTFIIYDETWTHEYTMNFDSIPEYISSINNHIGSNNTKLEVQVFPNPTSNLITIQYPKSNEIELSIFSISGIELAKKIDHNGIETVFDLSAYPKGIYLLQVKTIQGMRTVKVVRE